MSKTIKLPNSHLWDFKVNERNSVSASRATYSGGNMVDPPEDAQLALDIQKIEVEMKTKDYKRLDLKVGDLVEFPIEQDLTLTVQVAREEYQDVRHHARGEGGGVIAELIEDDLSLYDDDEEICVSIILKDGYAEEL